MIANIIVGSLEDSRFPGRNDFPLLGRPMAAYPMMAARHCPSIEEFYISTDSESLSRIAGDYGFTVLSRSLRNSGSKVPLEPVLAEAFDSVIKRSGIVPEMVVILLANAPTVTAPMIEEAIALLRQDSRLDGVTAISHRPQYAPERAYALAPGDMLTPYPFSSDSGQGKGVDAYFDASVLWVLRPTLLSSARLAQVKPNAIIDPASQRIRPLIFEGHGDLDYEWQVPGIAAWLRQKGFTEGGTPYGTDRSASVNARVESPSIHWSPPSPIDRRVLITTVPFGEKNKAPIERLQKDGIDYRINPLHRRLKEDEIIKMGSEVGVLIAGTEPLTRRVIQSLKNLRLIARVGVGLDNVDLGAARELGIPIAYTPSAPAPAVAEHAMGLILGLLRMTMLADRNMRQGIWSRHQGRRLAQCTVGMIGVGRIGKKVIQHLQGFSPKRIIAHDINPDTDFGRAHSMEWVDQETIFKEADVISLHVPLTALTRNMIARPQIEQMKPSTMLVNTARGGVVNESDLAHALRTRRLAGAAVDTFLQEPYAGELVSIDNCLLTSHMGSMSIDCRAQMEIEATLDVIRFLKKTPLANPVPDEEYDLQEGLKNA